MKAPWSSRRYCSPILVGASTLGLMLLVVIVAGALAHHALGTATQTDWNVPLARMDEALARDQIARAEILWSEACIAALRSRHWEGMISVADAYRRLGARAGFRADAKARQLYLTALVRARGEMSLEGVLRAAQGFAELNDDAVVEQCIRAAWRIAAQTRKPLDEQRVRAFAQRWAARTLAVDRPSLIQ
jgi:hypothetical protein